MCDANKDSQYRVTVTNIINRYLSYYSRLSVYIIKCIKEFTHAHTSSSHPIYANKLWHIIDVSCAEFIICGCDQRNTGTIKFSDTSICMRHYIHNAFCNYERMQNNILREAATEHFGLSAHVWIWACNLIISGHFPICIRGKLNYEKLV